MTVITSVSNARVKEETQPAAQAPPLCRGPHPDQACG